MYNKIPKSQIVQVKQQSIERWQTQWEQTTKGSTTKQFFPNIKDKKDTQVNTQIHSNSNSSREKPKTTCTDLK